MRSPQGDWSSSFLFRFVVVAEMELIKSSFCRILSKYAKITVIIALSTIYGHIYILYERQRDKHRCTNELKKKAAESKREREKKLFSRTAIHISCFVQWRRRHHLYVYRLNTVRFFFVVAEHNAKREMRTQIGLNGNFPISKINRKWEPRDPKKISTSIEKFKEKCSFRIAAENEYLIHNRIESLF